MPQISQKKLNTLIAFKFIELGLLLLAILFIAFILTKA
jgi:hypothetical protein